MILALAVTIAVIIALILILCFARVDYGLVFLVGTIGTVSGMFQMSTQLGPAGMPLAIELLIVSAVFACGFYTAVPKTQASPPPVTGPRSNTGTYFAVYAAGMLALYHLVVGGIPLFASDIEVSRFDFTSSGLFGIPGRMFLFGVPISWALATASARARSTPPVQYGPWKVATFFLVVISLLGGFKSGAISIVVTAALVLTVVFSSRPRLRVLLSKYWWAAASAIVYLIVVTALYPSYGSSSDSLIDQLLNRVTVVSAQPKLLALSGSVPGPPNGLLDEFSYFVAKYAGQSVSGQFTVERAISASIIGVDPASNAWTTPVTVGGLPELVYFFGFPAAVLISCAIGVSCGLLYRARDNAWQLFAAAVAVLCINLWVSRGGIAYYSLNFALVAAMILACYGAGVLVEQATRRGADRQRGNQPPSAHSTHTRRSLH